MKNINASDWLSKRNPCLISFLSSAIGEAINDLRTEKKKMHFLLLLSKYFTHGN